MFGPNNVDTDIKGIEEATRVEIERRTVTSLAEELWGPQFDDNGKMVWNYFGELGTLHTGYGVTNGERFFVATSDMEYPGFQEIYVTELEDGVYDVYAISGVCRTTAELEFIETHFRKRTLWDGYKFRFDKF